MRNRLSLLLVIVGALVAAGRCPAQSPLWREGVSLIPYPHGLRLGGEPFVIDGPLAIVLDSDASAADRFAAADLAERLQADWGIRAAVGGEAPKKIVLSRKGAPADLGEQGYVLSAGPEGVKAAATGEAGLFYATRSILRLVTTDMGDLRIPGLSLTDKPDIPYRAAHYDTKHHQDKAEYVRAFIRELADYKFNLLVWEWEDKFAYPSHPEIGAPGAFTLAEMQELTRYARQYHIQIVPLVQGLGHVSFILKWPQFAHLREIPASNWEFCPLKDGSYELLFDLWKDAMAATPGSEFLHIGTDETYELGQGVECGCAAKASQIGRRGLMLMFVDRCAKFILSQGRRPISWGGEYIPGDKQQPVKGLITAEFSDDPDIAKASREAGFPAWVYDPNPGIEHLFLPYMYRLSDDGQRFDGCLEHSYRTDASAARTGLFEGMINTSWDDSGLHNLVWMMSWANSAEYSWNGSAPGTEEFIDRYFVNRYGPRAHDLRELWGILNDAAYYYMDTFERKVWHWGEIGQTTLPDLPRGDAVEYDPFWNTRYGEMVQRSRGMLVPLERARLICRLNREDGAREPYDFEVFESIIDLTEHTAHTYLALSQLERTVTAAHEARFVSHATVLARLGQAADIVQANLDERRKVYDSLVAIWEKTRLPKGLSTPDKKFFWQQDRARHFAFRRPDMTYLICDEQDLGLEKYLTALKDYTAWYRNNFAAEIKPGAAK